MKVPDAGFTLRGVWGGGVCEVARGACPKPGVSPRVTKSSVGSVRESGAERGVPLSSLAESAGPCRGGHGHGE